jgi:thiol-disulfide isomerase/thioredoxin
MTKLYALALSGALLAATAAAQPPQRAAPPPPAQTKQPPQAQPPTQTQPPPPQAQPAAQPPSQQPAKPAPHAHEYAPLVERELDYKDWTFKTYPDAQPVNLREWARGKRLVLVAYFSPWCGNWRLERPVLARLHDKYKPHGFDVIAVSNYGTPAELKKHFDAQPAAYTVVVESDAHEAREKTAHFDYRRRTGDTRKWGSPYNVFLAPARLKPSGDVLAEKAWVVNGEMIEAEVEQFIRAQLGLPKEPGAEPAAGH